MKPSPLSASVILALLLSLPAHAAPSSQEPAAQTTVPGPVPKTKITEAYARMVASDAYFWAWPMINIYNRRIAFKDIQGPGLIGGIVPAPPPNGLTMLSDYIEPEERDVACPNQDVVYGASILTLDRSPAVIQVPDFGDRFWVYQVVDLRTDSFADLGKMYGTKPGFYLLVGPNWKGEAPKGITQVFRSKTNTGFAIPRVFQSDSAEDKKAVQTALGSIDIYPLEKFDGKMKSRDWKLVPKIPKPNSGGAEAGETRWVFPEKFVDELPLVLKDAPPLPGEEARYAEVLAVMNAAQNDPQLKAAVIDELKKTDKEIVTPLLQFRSYGLQLPHHWSTITNGAAFGTDYFTRTAAAKSNIFVNKQNETKYFYQDLDESGGRLNGDARYTVTFPAGQTPPVKGFWSLTLYNKEHFFAPNSLKRYSVGTKSQGLKHNADGSLTLYVQADSPGADKESNWLPSPGGQDFSLYVRTYWPEPAILTGSWTPPPVKKD
jgi:hypothetical protein